MSEDTHGLIWCDKLPGPLPVNPVPGLHLDEGKCAVDGIDPVFIEAIGEVLKYGIKKYARFNWTKGIAYTRVYASAMRHLLQWYQCVDDDPESGLPHLWHAATNLLFLISYTEHTQYNEFDDRPFCAKEGDGKET